MVFILGMLLGLIIGCALCVSYLRREIAANIGPALKRVGLQLDNVESQLNLAIITRYGELSSRSFPQDEPNRWRLSSNGRVDSGQASV